jgi:serine-type D-Ala-D-Ala carboxypeptidase/endopeptidase (penicillin-binding protein 4)
MTKGRHTGGTASRAVLAFALAVALGFLPPPAASSRAFASSVSVPAPARPRRLMHSLDQIIATGPVPMSQTGVAVSPVGDARPFVSLHATTEYMPASTMKLVTASAALERLGTGFRWQTSVSAQLTPTATGVVPGDLYLVGGGDPTLSTRAVGGGSPRGAYLDDLAQALVNRGVKRVSGDLVADESFFDTRRTGDHWKASYTSDCPPLSGLSLDRNASAGWGTDDQPALVAGKRFAAMLAARHIVVQGSVRVGTRTPRAVLLGRVWSRPLSDVVVQMDRTSDNFIAESVAKTLGRQIRGAGTSAAGAVVCASELASAGVPPAYYRIYDGSGLSRDDRLAPLGLVQLLEYADRRPFGGCLRSSLPVAGKSGTLAGRMRGTFAEGNVIAKTGTLSDVSALAGYATDRAGARFVFVVVSNGVDVASAKKLQDRIAEALAACTRR